MQLELSQIESQYLAHKKEFLALKWAFSERFQSTNMVIPLLLTPIIIL